MSRFSFLVFIVSLVGYAKAQGLYTVVGPGTIRPNSNYHVVASVHKSEVPCTIKVSLTGPEFETSKTVELQPYSSETINFEIPSIQPGDYNLTAEGISGFDFKNTTKLDFNKFEKFALIQTDKATYKPGDLVRFRVLILDKDTKPAKLETPVSISISDPAQNRIKQVNEAQFTKGVYSDELQLSAFPNLGNWEIDVQFGEEHEKKSFEVDKYVLPKFEVSIDVAKDIAKKDGVVKAIVRSKYTYGKPVKGQATLTIKPKYAYWKEKANDISKKAPLDGKASFEFDILDELKFENNWDSTYELSATVEEGLTGFQQNATADVTVHNWRYLIQGVNVPSNYVPNVPIDITVVVKNYDGSPVKDLKHPVKVELQPGHHWRPVPVPILLSSNSSKDEEKNKESSEPKPLKQEKILNENGMATFQFTIPESEESSFYSIHAQYEEIENNIGSLNKKETKTGSFFTLETQTEEPKLDKEVSMKVSSNLPLKYFFYQVIGRGDILLSAKEEVPDDRTYHVFKFKPTFEMVPSCNVLVYYIKDGEVVFDEKRVDFEQQLNNFVKINAPAQAKVGDEIDITVSSKPNSYVGLLGVDQSVLLLKSGNDLSKDDVFNTLHRFDTRTPWGGWDYGTKVPGRDSGVVTLTNAELPKVEGYFLPNWYPRTTALSQQGVNIVPYAGVAMDTAVSSVIQLKGVASPVSPVVTVRQLFLETWLWQSLLTPSESGEITIHNKVPDTITSWVLTGFSVNPEDGLGLTNQARKIQVFQPFFVSTNLPYSVKRGEVIAIPVVVFNYMDTNTEAKVTLENPNDEFEFIDKDENTEEKSEKARTKRVAIEKNSGVSKSFLIRPTKIGHITLKISAISPVAGDIVQQILRVDPEGVTEFVNKAVLFDLKDKNEKTEELTIKVPEDHVPDSIYAELSVVGDLLGPTIKNLDKLVRMPYGCGEQNMVNFVPNILVLRYLTKINKLTPTIEKKAKQHLEIGYQRELTYKHDDGSYSAFGKSDRKGSTWLTAYVARAFHEAKEFTEIDDKVIKEALEFLAQTQKESGQFHEVGKVIDHSVVDKSGKGIPLTAFTVLAFLENKEHLPKYQEVVNKGLDYLVKNIDDETDLYSLAVAAYTLQKAQHEQKDGTLTKLNERAKKDGDRQWWAEKEVELPKDDNRWWYTPDNADVEITAYGMLGLLEKGAGDETLPILKWLISKRNSNGGFASTQDTVVGLQALIKFAEKYNTEKGEVEINYTDDKGTNGKIQVNDDNAIVLQTHIIDPTAKIVTLNAKGKGSTLAQLSYRYNVDKMDDSPRFALKPEVQDSSNAELLKLSVCTSFIPQGDEKVSNMAVMEVTLPSGYVAEPDNLKELEKTDRVKLVETKNGESTVVIYFDDLDSTEVCPVVHGFRAHRVAEQKPAPVVVYDYYNNKRRATAFYEIKNTSVNEICGEEC